MRNAFVYIISNVSHRLYCGITADLRERVEQHKTGAYPNGFTARYHFDRLVYFEMAVSMTAAAKREKEIKKWHRSRRVALIQSLNPNWLDLSSRLDPLRSWSDRVSGRRDPASSRGINFPALSERSERT